MRLLSTAAANSKTAKAQLDRPDYTIVSLALSPAHYAKGYPSTCGNPSKSCIDACVGNVNVGFAQIHSMVMEARARRTAFFFDNRDEFMRLLHSEIDRERDKAYANQTILAARLNAFSDQFWERIKVPGTGGKSIIELFPDVSFWDYTKEFSRLHDNSIPPNYSLTASWTERPRDQEACAEILHNGIGNVAIVFGEQGGKTGRYAYDQKLPRTWNVAGRDFVCYDGDTQDMRFLDWSPRRATNAKYGRICALRLKAGNHNMRLRALASGFAVSTD